MVSRRTSATSLFKPRRCASACGGDVPLERANGVEEGATRRLIQGRAGLAVTSSYRPGSGVADLDGRTGFAGLRRILRVRGARWRARDGADSSISVRPEKG